MPITKYIKGNLLYHDGPIAHGVNCMGKMRSGVAKDIREKYPHHYDDYIRVLRNLKDCGIEPHQEDEYLQTSYVMSARELPFRYKDSVTGIFTQNNYGYDGKRYVNYYWVGKGFEQLYINLDLNLNGSKYPVGIPKIGAGLGGGDWEVIEQIINDATPNLEIWVYEL